METPVTYIIPNVDYKATVGISVPTYATKSITDRIVDAIFSAVEAYTGFTRELITQRKAASKVVETRQCVCWAISKHTNISHIMIGQVVCVEPLRRLTVRHAVSKIEALFEQKGSDPVKPLLNFIINQLESNKFN